MADKQININVAIEDADSAQTIGEMNKSLKSLVSLQGQIDKSSPDFKKLQKAINETDDKIGGLKDSFNTLRGSGVERLNSSVGLLSEGFKNFDLEKVSTAFKGLGTAMKAVPIFLIIEGIQYLVENFDKLSKGSGLLGTILRGIGDIFTWLIDKIYEFTDAIGLTNSALDKQGEALETNAEKAKVALEKQTKEYDNQIAAAKAAGKSTVDLEIAKQEAIVNTNKALVEQTIAYVRNGGVLTDEQNKLLTEQIETIKNAKAQENIIKIGADKEAFDKWKEKEDERKKKVQEDFEDYKKKYKETDDYRRKIDDDFAKWQHEESVKARKVLEANVTADKEGDLVLRDFKKENAEEVKKKNKEVADAERENQNENQKKFQAYANLTIATLNGIFDMVNQKRANELAQYNEGKEAELKAVDDNLNAELAKEGLTEEQKTQLKYKAAQEEYQIKLAQYNQNLAIKKKEFENGKKQAIALALINGAVGAVAALSAVPFFPMAIIGLALATITTAFSVAKIASTKFDSGGGPPSPPPMPSMGGSGASSGEGGGFKAPQFFGLGEGKPQVDVNTSPQKVYVTEGDITAKQKKVGVIENAATIG